MDDAPGVTDTGSVQKERNLVLWLIVGIGVLVTGLVAFWVGSAALPRWWAQRIGGLIDGRLVFGSLVGLTVGFVFTLLPLIALRLTVRYGRGPRRLLVLAFVVVLLASPNLATLGIVVGDGNAAHAGERILDVDGPGFRGGTVVGVVFGALAAIGLLVLFWSRGRNKRRASELEAELDRKQ